MSHSAPTPTHEQRRGRHVWLGLIATIAILIGIGLTTLHLVRHHYRREFDAQQALAQQAIHQAASKAQANAAASQLPGTLILKNYASAASTPQADLTDLSHALDNFALLSKGHSPLPLGANEDLARALRGHNATQLRFIPDDHPVLNALGQLIDRWGTPLFFHANEATRLDIRSAGPDKQMWTADDIHRRYDGQFIQGEALNAASLFEATKNYRRTE
jgi:hypothetical protein